MRLTSQAAQAVADVLWSHLADQGIIPDCVGEQIYYDLADRVDTAIDQAWTGDSTTFTLSRVIQIAREELAKSEAVAQ